MSNIVIEGVKSFTVDGKEYPFIPLEEWSLNDCCLFEEASGVEYAELLAGGLFNPRNLRAAMYVIARHHGLELSLEDAGDVSVMKFMEAAAGEDAAAEVDAGPPVKAPSRRQPRRKASSSASRS